MAGVLPAESLLIAIPDHGRLPSVPGDEIGALMSPQSGSSWLLAQFMIRRPAETALDACTGSGVLGLLCTTTPAASCSPTIARRRSRPPPSTPTSTAWPISTAGRGISSSPSRASSFDYIVSNPPFVVSPRRRGDSDFEVYRDAGLPADSVSEHVVRSMARLLRPGGFAQALINWIHVRGENDEERLRLWAAGSGCDVWVARMATLDPAGYATAWLPTPDNYADSHVRRFEAWLAYYEANGVEAISQGLITLRARPGGRNWFACQEPPRLIGRCGDDLRATFDRRDLLEGLTDEALLGMRLVVVPSVRWRQEWRMEGGEEVDGTVRIDRTEGLATGWPCTATPGKW